MADIDIDDEAIFANQQALIQNEIDRARNSLPSRPSRYCKFCKDELPPDRDNFCDADCRGFFEHEEKIKRIKGEL